MAERNRCRRQAKIDQRRRLPDHLRDHTTKKSIEGLRVLLGPNEPGTLAGKVQFSAAHMDAILESGVHHSLEELYPTQYDFVMGNDYFMECQDANCLTNPLFPLYLATPDSKQKMITLAQKSSQCAREVALTTEIRYDILKAYCDLCQRIVQHCSV